MAMNMGVGFSVGMNYGVEMGLSLRGMNQNLTTPSYNQFATFNQSLLTPTGGMDENMQ
jgi:hypothetical protein